MPDRRGLCTGRDEQTDAVEAPATSTPSPGSGLTPEQVRRWAELIAAGSTEFPDDLPSADYERLLAETRRVLRSRLVGIVARAVAMDICRDNGRDREVTDDD